MPQQNSFDDRGDPPDVADDPFYRASFEHAAVAMIVHYKDGCVVNANRAFAKLLDCELEEARNLCSTDVVHPDDLPLRNAEAANAFAWPGLSGGRVMVSGVSSRRSFAGRV